MCAAYETVFSSPPEADMSLDLKRLQIVTLVLQNILVGFVEFFFPFLLH